MPFETFVPSVRQPCSCVEDVVYQSAAVTFDGNVRSESAGARRCLTWSVEPRKASVPARTVARVCGRAWVSSSFRAAFWVVPAATRSEARESVSSPRENATTRMERSSASAPWSRARVASSRNISAGAAESCAPAKASRMPVVVPARSR